MKKFLLVSCTLLGLAPGLRAQTGSRLAPTTAISTATPYAADFAEAYRLYPVIPRGMLEAVAYTQTHIRHIGAEEQASCMGMPLPAGVMGLIADGKGHFRENLRLVAQLSDVSVERIKADPRSNILAYAAAYARLANERQLRANMPARHLPVLLALSELPLDRDALGTFALDSHLYSVLTFLTRPENQSRYGFPDYKLDLPAIFGANYRVLSAGTTQVSERQVQAEGQVFDPGGSTYSLTSSTDYGPALTNLTTCNFSSRSGTAITHYAIHTVQGTYAGCISWFKNCSSSVSAHYVVRSSDGQVTQMVTEANKAWHIGSENPYTIGTEHEGYVNDASWYTTAMYTSSAALARDIVGSGYGISGLRTFYGAATTGTFSTGACVKIKGHQHFPNQTHTDPGVNWDWERFYTLVNNAPTVSTLTAATGTLYDAGGPSANYPDDVRQCQLIAPTGASSVRLTFSSFDLENAYDHLLVYNGANNQAPLLGKFSGTTNPGTLTASSGKMYLELRSDCATTRAGFAASWSSVGGGTASCPTDSYEANETLAAGKSIGVNVNNLAYVCPATDVDWYQFTSSSTNNNIKVTLSTLPADYELQLYTAGGTLLYSSTSASTTAETIVYNGAPAATYYVRVYGYNGATSNTTAYTLRVSTQATAWAAPETPAFASRQAAEKPQVSITNPVQSGDRAWLSVTGYDGPAEIQLRNTQGQPLGAGFRTKLATGQPVRYALPGGLQPGVYLVMVQLSTHVEYLRLLVQ
ncbi:N-acetylmuramoyl-L-alanine amidase [Microvirga sp. STR05]|uniref:N-acetylmuramoyl-L-alanine amidase n=1 Tax=Hymenobacter duratus TaxID=2771356 RepID=A0ABR8JI01_9BACT|nr:N-acetylmuramoyl-L-alanine amidase [Hymenobacter duratus]MBD2716482.1 N-acetylmuramoyl-L-alanine amidase [Hymenobacter duratus]MBR7951397.1 N-acetylmuramoyl-L-alanine amidase [Microvirga sp. STR05]